uniref:Uncharacterized protein AlNc14C141G7240 n=1 Tax=Albugo laibachii Nc14 TaxID=890382 RepID=F0WL52_9STRA|nr:conserved hypothetical protein [Albugo laibachii Nc14]|eukprot:CCA22013.1 conserved hypothetical protein [Albugo laibachii Nc14]
MRILMHNMLVCNVRACRETIGTETSPCKSNTSSLKIIAYKDDGIVIAETVYSKAFILHVMDSIDYAVLCQATRDLSHPEVPVLMEPLPSDWRDQDLLLRRIHRVIFDVNIVEGELVCSHCERSYPITNAVPNMTLEDDEL